MAMALLGFGSIEYNSDENFAVYLERFEIFLDCNNIPQEKKKSTFLTVIGPKLYALLKNLCVPQVPSDKTYEELKDILLKHLEPQSSVIVERYKFNNRDQKTEETVSEYVSELKKISLKCKFGDRLNDMQRDRFIAGLLDRRMKTRILNEPKEGMTLAKAIDIATNMEKTERNVQEMWDTQKQEGNVLKNP